MQGLHKNATEQKDTLSVKLIIDITKSAYVGGFRLNRIENSRATKNAATHAANRVHKRCMNHIGKQRHRATHFYSTAWVLYAVRGLAARSISTARLLAGRKGRALWWCRTCWLG